MKWQLHYILKNKNSWKYRVGKRQPSIPTSQVNEKLTFDDDTKNENGHSPTLKVERECWTTIPNRSCNG
jgi:hypothetical protein